MLRSRWGVAALAAGTIAVGGIAAGAVGAFGGGGGGTSAEDLAGAINERAGTSITAEQVRAAYADLLAERLDAEVAAGRLTRAQADGMLQRAKDAPIGAPLVGPHGGPGRRADLLGPVASLLGITEDALHARLHEGRSLAAIARAEGVSRADLVAAIQTVVDRAEPALTDAQARARAGAIADDVHRPGFGGGGRGRGGGFGPPPGP